MMKPKMKSMKWEGLSFQPYGMPLYNSSNAK